MNEATLKRALIRSLRAQDGVGFRVEDRYRVGVPDMLMLPKDLPGFLIEAKIIKGAKLVCTPSQAIHLRHFHRPPFFLAAVVGWNDRREALYIGQPEQPLAECRYVPRPSALDSSEWRISELLGKLYYDATRTVDVGRSRTI